MYLIGIVGRFVRWAVGVATAAVVAGINWVRPVNVRPVRVMGGNMVHPVRVTPIPAIDKLDDVYGGKD